MEWGLVVPDCLSLINPRTSLFRGKKTKIQPSMKFLHTADWHIGRMLYGKKRYPEFSAFLDWLLEQLTQHEIDTLLIPGDIFDTRAPSNRAQQLYYDFLIRASRTCCQHIVITSGNHDSPSFLDAPKSILRALNVHVIGLIGNPDNKFEDELIELKHPSTGQTEALIAAVPYLRDKDLRKVEAGESIDEKEEKIVAGIHAHYQTLADLATDKQSSLTSPNIPIIAMGHLFALGGKTGDGVRDLYVGNLGSVGADTFPDTFHYTALGHLHVPQKVGGKEHIRYSGSPIPMGYGEAGQQKEILIIDSDGTDTEITPVHVPCFQKLLRLNGNLDELLKEISHLIEQQSSAWLEIDYSGTDTPSDLRTRLHQATDGSDLEIRRIKNTQLLKTLRQEKTTDEALEDLSEIDVFTRCLNAHDIPEADRPGLMHSYQEILTTYHESDTQAE